MPSHLLLYLNLPLPDAGVEDPRDDPLNELTPEMLKAHIVDAGMPVRVSY